MKKFLFLLCMFLIPVGYIAYGSEPPTLTITPSNQTVTYPMLVPITATVNVTGTQPIEVVVTSGPGSLSGNTLTIDSGLAEGTHIVELSATNDYGGPVTASFTLTVNPPADVIPSFTNAPGNQTLNQPTTQLTLPFTVIGTPTPNVTVSGAGSIISGGNVIIPAGLTVGPHEVTLTANSAAGTDTATFTITVNPAANIPPTTISLTPTSVPRGNGANLSHAGGTATGATTWATANNWPTGITLNTNTGLVSVGLEAPLGTHSLQVRVTVGGVVSGVLDTTITVTAANHTLNLAITPPGHHHFEARSGSGAWVRHDSFHYTINFVAGQTFNQVVNSFPEFRIEGHTLPNNGRWRLHHTNGTVVPSDHPLTNGMTIYAHWVSASSVTVTLNPRGGTWAGISAGQNRPLQMTANQTLSQWQNANEGVAAVQPVRTGYEFVGWFIGDTRDEVAFATSHFTQNVTLNARWRPTGSQVSTITFNPNGGTWRAGGSTNRTQPVRSSSNLQNIGILSWEALDMVPTRTGFTFGGFRQTNNQNTFTVTTNVTTSTVSLEAIWTSTDQVNLIFNPNGGNFPGQTGSRTFRIGRGQHISGYFGQTIDQLAGIPTRSGYTFAGWYVGNTNTAFTVTTSIDVNTTVNARWTANDLPGWTAPPTPTPPVSPPPTLPTTFNDVHQGQWYFNYVNTVSSLGIFQGTGNNQFSPNVNMTRAMFTQALANLHNANTAGLGTTFSDVGNNVWYTGPITWAFNSGIVQGTGDGRFNPNANITREQIALMLFNYANFAGVTLPTTGWTGNFNDANQISPWASIAVEALHAAGVITGRPGGTFDPQAQATRAEVAAMFARFAQFR